jgi:hypothetical protein
MKKFFTVLSLLLNLVLITFIIYEVLQPSKKVINKEMETKMYSDWPQEIASKQ